MRTFAMIYQTFWTGKTGRELRKASPLVQVVALYLISSPHSTFTGLYSLPVAYATHDLGMNTQEFEDALKTLDKLGFAKYDPTHQIVFVINAAKYQIGNSLKPADKRVKAVQSEVDIIPDECLLKQAFYEKYASAYHLDTPNSPDASTLASRPRADYPYSSNGHEDDLFDDDDII